MADLKTLLGDKYKEGMTLEELMALDIEIPKDDAVYDNLKKQLDKASSEAAEYKRKLRENMSEAERKALEDAERMQELQDRVKTLELEKTIAENEKNLIAIGYDEKSAKVVANALYKGDFATVFAEQANFVDAQKKAALAKALKDTPPPPAGGKPDTLTKDDFKKMSIDEKTKLYTEQPELYAELSKK